MDQAINVHMIISWTALYMAINRLAMHRVRALDSILGRCRRRRRRRCRCCVHVQVVPPIGRRRWVWAGRWWRWSHRHSSRPTGCCPGRLCRSDCRCCCSRRQSRGCRRHLQHDDDDDDNVSIERQRRTSQHRTSPSDMSRTHNCQQFPFTRLRLPLAVIWRHKIIALIVFFTHFDKSRLSLGVKRVLDVTPTDLRKGKLEIIKGIKKRRNEGMTKKKRKNGRQDGTRDGREEEMKEGRKDGREREREREGGREGGEGVWRHEFNVQYF